MDNVLGETPVTRTLDAERADLSKALGRPGAAPGRGGPGPGGGVRVREGGVRVREGGSGSGRGGSRSGRGHTVATHEAVPSAALRRRLRHRLRGRPDPLPHPRRPLRKAPVEPGGEEPPREPDACSPSHCLFLEEILDESVCQRLTKQIEQCLVTAKTSPLRCRELLIPRGLSRRVAHDVMRVSANEPCGLRGAVVYLHLESEGVSEKLGAIERDGAVVPTFELTLVFKQEGRGWPRLRELLSVGGCFVSPGWRRALKLSPGFRLVKRKLYSSAGPIVEEC
ncbi:DNA damage-inducible transcript 4-like protein-like [Callorhinchus milii]|uniref:DNA damage-inducible transcript 4-like protein-like n=1 Tax=Callorhinchus milii TaxID=7868 RepID=UPI001C3FB04F|nr:DNA damage-inducible transcript 4-like protein-like [Callorhinchus milii]